MSVKVTIVIPSYNSARWLPTAIASCYQQGVEKKIIVVDDASTDGTREVVDDYLGRDDFCYLRNARNQGAPYSRNRGMEHAEGTHIVFLDADDFFEDSGLITLIDSLRGIEDADMSIGNIRFVDQHGNEQGVRRQGSGVEDPILSMLRMAPLPGSAVIRLDVARRIRWEHDLTCAQEFDYFFRLGMTGPRIKYCDSIVLKVRRHPSADRISVKNKHLLVETLARLILGYHRELTQTGKLADESRIVFNTVLNALYLRLTADTRERRSLESALYERIDKGMLKRNRNFRYRSLHGLSYLTSPNFAKKLRRLNNTLKARAGNIRQQR